MTNAAAYARLSLDRHGQGVAVERQLADCRRIAAQRGWTIVAEHVDNSRSAWRAGVHRPGWEQLLAGVEHATYDAIVVYHGDRLIRQPRDLERLIDLVERRRVPVASVAGTRDLGSPDDRFILRIETAAACRESDATSRRIRRVQDDKAAAGARHGRVPYGWRSDAEGDIVREVTGRLLAGDTLRTITNDLNARGIAAPNGGRWTGTQVRQIVRRASNAGLRQHRGAIVGDAAWPALLPRDDWERAVRLLADPARRTNAGRSRTWLLSGLLWCGVCRTKMIHAHLKGYDGRKPRGIYRCREMHVSIGDTAADAAVLDLVAARLSQPDAAGLTGGDGTQGELLARLEVLDHRSVEAAEMYAAGTISGAQLAAITARLSAERDQVDAALREVDASRVDIEGIGTERAGEVVRGLPLDRQRALIAALVHLTLEPAGGKGGTGNDVSRISVVWR